MINAVLIIIGFVLLTAYVSIEWIVNKDVPTSISNSFYIYNEKKKGLGYVFTIFMFIEAYLMVVPMIDMGTDTTWQFLGFLCPAGIAFCGSAPLSRGVTLESKVHVVGATSAAILGLIWCFVYCKPIIVCDILITYLFAVTMTAWYTDTVEKCRTFWVELLAFPSILTVMLGKSLGVL